MRSMQVHNCTTVEATVRGMTPQTRLAARQHHSSPIIAALKPWFEKQLSMTSSGSKLAEDIRYGLAHWEGRKGSPASWTMAGSSSIPTRSKTPSVRYA